MQTTFSSLASAFGRETQQRRAGIGHLFYTSEAGLTWGTDRHLNCKPV